MFNRVFQKEHIAVVCLFERRDTGSRLVLANSHIEWNPAFSDVKTVQVALLVEQVQKLAEDFAKLPPRLRQDPSLPPYPSYTDGTKIPIVVAADLNSIPESAVYEFLDQGKLSPNHPDFMSYKYGLYTEKGLSHDLNLKSAYSCVGELSLTNFTSNFKAGIDYLWYSTPTLSVSGVLGKIDEDYISKVVGFPNPHFPSEYVQKPLSFWAAQLTLTLKSHLHHERIPCEAAEVNNIRPQLIIRMPLCISFCIHFFCTILPPFIATAYPFFFFPSPVSLVFLSHAAIPVCSVSFSHLTVAVASPIRCTNTSCIQPNTHLALEL